jgi:hypothetical protein
LLPQAGAEPQAERLNCLPLRGTKSRTFHALLSVQSSSIVPSPSENAVREYITAMRAARATGAFTAETTFYTPVQNLINAVGATLKPRVLFVAHPSTTASRKLPDGGLFAIPSRRQSDPLPGQRPERGVVEIKPPGESLAALASTQQVLDYLRDFGLCLITNYHQFQLLDLVNGQPHVLESYTLTATAEALWSESISNLIGHHKVTLPDFLARALTRRIPLEKPKDLAWLLASYAREARARAETHPLAAFEGVKSALQESLGITFEGEKGEHFFLSTLIQTLFYGIFSAWILWRRTPDFARANGIFNWRLSAQYLRVPVLRTLFYAVAEPGALRTVGITEVLDHAADALNRVQPDFFTTFREEDAVVYFYEPFLEAFDPELRKQLGVWYTPREIVRYMVERVDHLLRTELNEPLGLASTNVQVLDPCCGTGAYLVEVLHRIERTLREQAGDDDALVGADLRRAATTRIFGFELMPAPFVISHLQITHLLESANSSLAENQRAQVFLTNALTGWVPVKHPQSKFGFPAFIEERDAAEAIKQAETILVILGNPPYNGYPGIAKIEEERDLTNAYRHAIEGLPAPQGQGLNELYVRFFRVAERRIVGDEKARGNKSQTGIVSFISGYKWLDGLSHPTMRYRLLQEFDSIYVDNLNGDKYRTGKTTPEGKPDPSAFSTQQNREGIQVGTAITTLIRSKAHRPSSSIGLRNIWGTEKLAILDRDAKRESNPIYDEVTPAPVLGLRFADRTHSLAVTSWPRLPDMFPIYFPGVKTSRDPLVIDIDRDRLDKRIKEYLDPKTSNEQIAIKFPPAMKKTGRFDPAKTREELLPLGFKPWQILRYVYRPFDLRWIYWEPKTRLIGEKSEDYLEQLFDATPWLEARQTESGDAFCRGSIVSSLPDNFGNGFSTFFPLDTLKIGDLLSPTTVAPNLSDNATQYLNHLQVPTDVLFFHSLATVHSAEYRSEQASILLGDWPRIPLPATAELLTNSATLGRRLAELLDPESDVQLAAEWSFLAKLSIAAEFPEGTPERDQRNAARFALTAGWGGAGQGATVMPRRGDARERDWTPTQLERLATLAASQSLTDGPELTLDDALSLLGPRCVDVYLNGASYWAAVPVNVWEYTLGGYQVLKKWLSYRELPLLGRPLHEEEARYFAQVVRRIAAILLMGPALDASYAAILPAATGLPTT